MRTRNQTAEFDVFLYDALSGGAGYCSLAAKYLKEIVDETLEFLNNCDCDNSCNNCLRHFHNQHIVNRLNRHLAYDFLNYALNNIVPETISNHIKNTGLNNLSNFLEMDGYKVTLDSNLANKRREMIITNSSNKKIIIRTYSKLLRDNHNNENDYHDGDTETMPVSDYDLINNLPQIHSNIQERT